MAHPVTPTECPCGSSHIVLCVATRASIVLDTTFTCKDCGFKGFFIPEWRYSGGVYPDGQPKTTAIPDSTFSLDELLQILDMSTIGLEHCYAPQPERDRLIKTISKLGRRLAVHRDRESWEQTGSGLGQ